MKSVLITGCSKGGIGDALAQEFYSKGLLVFATARDLSKVEHLKSLGLTTLKLDVTSAESIKNAVAEVEAVTGGKLDFLVNNAGMGYTMPLLDASLEETRILFELNVFSVLAVTQAFAPCLIAAKGKIINIGSIVGKMAQAYTGIYNTSKAATNLLSETLRLELAPFDVQVITYITGIIGTPFFERQGTVKLPQDSFYLPLQDKINEAAAGENIDGKAMERSIYASKVVANALKPRSKLWVWLGAQTLLVWVVTTFLPHTFPDSLFSKSSRLDTLRALREADARRAVKSDT